MRPTSTPPPLVPGTPSRRPRPSEERTARAFPLVNAVILVMVALIALVDLNDSANETLGTEVFFYVISIAVPAAGLFLAHGRLVSNLTIGIVADIGLTGLLLARLIFGQATVSGTAAFLSMKILGSALLIPWGAWPQAVSGSLSTVFYWLVLMALGTTIEPKNWLHQACAPLLSAVMASAGAAISARIRREHGEAEERLELALEQARRAENEKAALLDIARDISGTVDLEAVVRRVQAHALALLPCDGIATVVVSPDGESLRVIGADGMSPSLRERALADSFPLSDAILADLVAGRSFVVAMERMQPFLAADVMRRYGVRHAVLAPMRVAGRLFGALVGIRSQGAQSFGMHQVAVLEGIAGQLALVLEVIELYGQAKEDADAEATVARVARALIEAVGEKKLMARLCELTRSALSCDAAMVYELDSQSHELVATASVGLSADEWATLGALVLPQGEVSRLDPNDPDLPREAGPFESAAPDVEAVAMRFGFTQVLRIPLRQGGEVMGILAAGRRGKAERFSHRQVQIAKSLGQLASLVWQNTRLIEQLELANRIQSDFVATMSHELRTPLNIITGYTNLLVEDAFGTLNAEQLATLRRVARSAQELTELVNTTLQVGRLDSGGVPLSLSDVGVADLVEEALAETVELWERDGLELRRALDPTLGLLRTDRGKLKVVLKNLIGNAAKFTESGWIEVRARRCEEGVCIEVQDSGVGIAPESMPIIFQRFRQADSSMTRRFGGVGLGLYIVSRLLELLGGRVEVESTLGKGSTFRLILPASPITEDATGRRLLATA